MNAGLGRNGVSYSSLAERTGCSVPVYRRLRWLSRRRWTDPRIVEGTEPMMAVDVVAPQLVAVTTRRPS